MIENLMRCFASLIGILGRCFKNVSTKKKGIKPGLGSAALNQKKSEGGKKKMVEQYASLIEAVAKKNRLNPNLVMALVKIESSFNTDAMRYESHYAWLYKPEDFAKKLKITVDTETQLQKFSYGLMQSMGAVARENGFSGPLFKLCRPDIGIEYGCIHFAKYMMKYNDVNKALAAYNGGPGAINQDGSFSNQGYVDKVMNEFTVRNV